MNIAFDPWIPVVSTSGERVFVSLCEILCEGERFADLAVRPHERVSLMRLFLCVAHASLDGPKDYGEWLEVPKKLAGAVQQYLSKWEDSFELFHETKPWLQVAGLHGALKDGVDSGKTSPVALLDFELATGNNSTLNDHFGIMNYRPILPERLAINLLTFQNFSPGGGSPIAQWKAVKTSQVGNPDAPCLSQSMAHCLLRGKTLSETIQLNIPHYESVDEVYKSYFKAKKGGEIFSDIPYGRPVWEAFPESPSDSLVEVNNASRTYLGRLVPISRWIRLIKGSDQMHCCSGFKYDTFKDGFAAEPTASVRLVKKKDSKGAETQERKVIGVHPNRAMWRELSSLLIQRHTNGLGGPLALKSISKDIDFDFHVCAMIRNQASMDTAVESVFHITQKFQDNLSIYRSEVEMAERTSHGSELR